ncbi:uncharacterized protein LY79DRAFT_518794 [Colletotrichum navitas]|uniref:Rhodopsin domain-containing protein n=1 Tax=Colletotrichum navitas TaxID=681940 RepID=A0AAD8PVG5_9PEZI|nr:uncharacterized protein LY79DRAFT_518794 [Colletotrichum navitas]KAK1585454.1 hypothetical protein LY79DRAFT_518794 [Colletotrichum navitas]
MQLCKRNSNRLFHWTLAKGRTAIELGFGHDIWMLCPEQVTRILIVFFVDEIMYAIIISVTKTSIILLYLPIFPKPWFRKTCRMILYITGIFGVWHILQILFVCWPMSYNWTYWDGEHSGRCGDRRLFSSISAGINIALDWSPCLLPITQL